MKEYDIIESIRLYVMKAQVEKALDELYNFLSQINQNEKRNELMLLSSQFHEIKKRENLGIGEYLTEKNRIIHALLKLLESLEKKDVIKTQNKSSGDDATIKLIESKIDFLLHHVEKYDDVLFYGFNNSILWEKLEESSKENLLNANIIEKEAKQDNYKAAVSYLMKAIQTEFDCKFFNKLKKGLEPELKDKKLFIQSLKGNNLNNLYKYLTKGEKVLSINQLSDIILHNILLVEKNKLEYAGKSFYYIFHNHFKIKNKEKAIEFFKTYSTFNLNRYLKTYTLTLVDVINMKEDVFNLLLNIQAK